MSTGSGTAESVPVVAYCILHQARSGASREEYGRILCDLHRQIREQASLASAEQPRAVREAVLRQVQLLMGALSPYLETPMRGDASAVRGILEDSLGSFAGRVAPPAPPSLRLSLEGRVHIPPLARGVVRRLLQQGRDYLGSLGFATGKTDPPLHESVFVVTGGGGLDLLEHCVRDRIGIYGGTHGRHLSLFHRSTYAAYNLIHNQGDLPDAWSIPGWTEGVLFFSKPAMRYDEFRDRLTTAAASFAGESALVHGSLWQRKLGLGSGLECVLRLVARDGGAVTGILERLAATLPDSPVRTALLSDGRLLLQEVLFPS